MSNSPKYKSEFSFKDGEVLLINKPYTWSSFQVVNKIRYTIRHFLDVKKIKVGHAGTLDPLATGLLIICTGKFTKRIEEFQAHEKEYTGKFYLGATTPCFDLEKEVDQTFPIEHITEEQIFSTAKSFLGDQDQVPPIFSAIRIDGKRAYRYARDNEEVVIKPKHINIAEFEITKFEMPEIHFRIVCSKGTYIRSIARDFGLALESGAYLSELKRTRIGEFKLTDALEIEEFKQHLEDLK